MILALASDFSCRQTLVPVSNAVTGAISCFRGFIFQIAFQKGSKDLLAKIEPGIAAEIQSAEGAGVFDLLAVMPRTDHQKYLVIRCVLGLDGFVYGHGAVNVFLIPQAVHQHNGDFQWLGGQ